MISGQNNILKFSHAENLMPQEEVLEMSQKKGNLKIGLPKEIFFEEQRIALVPQAVGLLVANGHEVLVETDAGIAAHFSNNEYSEAGAHIVYSSEEVYQADIILKVAPPLLDELDHFRNRQTLFSAMHMTGQTRDYFWRMMSKKMTAIAFEEIRDREDSYPIRRSMSEIVGSTVILIAAEYLSHPDYGKGVMLGGFTGITPSEVVIIGAGTVAEYAARAALGLGADVRIFDNSIYKLRRLQKSINTRIFTSIIQPKVLMKALKTADVVIGALYSAEGRTPCVVTEEMVSQMKPGSVIVDVSIDQGGCVETSQVTMLSKPVFKKYDVTHYGVPNIAAMVPHTASYALSNFFAPILIKTGDVGGVEKLLLKDLGMRHGVYLYNGVITKKYVSEMFNLPFQDIDLLIAAFR